MNKRALRADILLMLTAAIWGFGFVAQRSGMEYVGPFAFNGIRFILGSISLLPFIFIRRSRFTADIRVVRKLQFLNTYLVKTAVLQAESRKTARLERQPTGLSLKSIVPSRQMLLPSIVAGSCLFIAVILQQFGLLFTTAGNAGFITGLYVVFTPIVGIFLGRKTGLPTWIGSVLTLTGLYFISAAGRSSVNPGDVITVISALFWTAHVLLIDHFMNVDIQRKISVDPVELSAGQFAICGILMLLGAFFAESHVIGVVEKINPSLLDKGLFKWQPFPALIAALKNGTMRFSFQIIIPILYGGFCSVGIAYTLQVVAQRDAPPAHAVIILCFEGCFAALGGVLLLAEKVGVWTLLGFVLMLAGMLATQWEVIASVNKN
jgi:drug/metabolite transporter (DMT)-like permease